MSQNDKLIKKLGLPVLSKSQKKDLRSKWQNETWDDMVSSLNSYGKYIMLRPTGFGKTYTCACACNIGLEEDTNGNIVLNNGTTINNDIISSIGHKKVIFVYISEILKQTFAEYEQSGVIKNNSSGRILYETYNMVSKHWGDKEYLLNTLTIQDVGLVIFDEAQRMGATETAKSLDVALPILEELGIPYIGATATVERATGYDVCDKYFTYTHENGKQTYCWGEHIYTLEDTFRNGLLIPPEYQYIEEDKKIIKKARQTRLSMLQELKISQAEATTDEDKKVVMQDIRELETAIIKGSDKIVHDTMLTLYQCPNKYKDAEELCKVKHVSKLCVPVNLPKYMRFLVFTPDRASMSDFVNTHSKDTEEELFGGMVKQTVDIFKSAFGRYGYKVRITVISSINNEERQNVHKLTSREFTEADVESGKVIVKQDGIIDLIFSINMLNVGYHVSDITGLIFKRWTGSNQVYYQQLGRCLSADCDDIPVVFDFVKSIDSRGITAPLFTKHEITKDTTENADGTQNVTYNDKTKNKPRQYNKYEMLDMNGNPVDPKKCNTIDAKYITVSMTSASIDDILKREQVYMDRLTAIKLFDKAYENYTKKIVVKDKQLVSDINKIPNLKSSLLLAIKEQYKTRSDLSINFKAYLEYLKKKCRNIYIEYTIFKKYISDRDNGKQLTGVYSEVNSILAMARTDDNKQGIIVKLLVNKEDVNEFKRNSAVISELRKKKFSGTTDIILY